MPATWMVLVFLYIQFGFSFIELIILGTIASTLGRGSLYLLSRHYIRNFLPHHSKENFDGLGSFLNKHKHTAFWLIIFFAGPFPSNQFFVGSGFAKLKLPQTLICFFSGRLLNYSILVWISGLVSGGLHNYLKINYLSYVTISTEVLGFFILYLISKVSWHKVLISS